MQAAEECDGLQRISIIINVHAVLFTKLGDIPLAEATMVRIRMTDVDLRKFHLLGSIAYAIFAVYRR